MPHRLVGLIAVIAMAAGALIEAAMVWLVEPLMDETLVAHNLETAAWIPFAFIGIFIGRGIAGFSTEASLGWIGRSVISALRRDVFNKFLTLPSRFIEKHATGPMLSRMTYNVEMVAESVTSVVTIVVRDLLTAFAAMGVMIYQSVRLFVFVMILFPVIAAIVHMLGKAFRRYSGRIQDSVGERVGAARRGGRTKFSAKPEADSFAVARRGGYAGHIRRWCRRRHLCSRCRILEWQSQPR
jgi:subfamily B ATP-binding cassette protein MsbA